METTTYLVLRLAIAASMFGHGLVRLPKLSGFSTWMAGSFEKSIVPSFLVTPFSYALPVAELVIGLFLLLGVFTRKASIAGSFVMIALIFGACMIENWEAIPSQLIHVGFFAVLIQFVKNNTWAMDNVIGR